MGTMAQEQERAPTNLKKRPWQLPSVLCAIVVTILGLAAWIYAVVTAPQVDRSGTNGSGVPGGASALVEARAAPDGGVEPEPRTIDTAAPAIFRFGLSFLAGFALGFVLKKFIKISLLVGAVLAAAIWGLQASGLFTLPWDQIHTHISDSLSWMKGQAEGFKEFITGYLPSSMAAAAGVFIGLWRG
jgi:uncharacterized membrane protein (Fun14 family)